MIYLFIQNKTAWVQKKKLVRNNKNYIKVDKLKVIVAKYIYTKLIIKYKEIIVSYIYTINFSYRKCANCITTL